MDAPEQHSIADESSQTDFDLACCYDQLAEARQQLALAKVGYWVAKKGLDPSTSAAEYAERIRLLRRLVDVLRKIAGAVEGQEPIPEPAQR